MMTIGFTTLLAHEVFVSRLLCSICLYTSASWGVANSSTYGPRDIKAVEMNPQSDFTEISPR